MLVMARGMMCMAMGGEHAAAAVEGRERISGRVDNVSGEMIRQPQIEGNGDHAEPDAEPIAP
jgi:hypothetical protein